MFRKYIDEHHAQPVIRVIRHIPKLDIATSIASTGFVVPKSLELELDVKNHLAEGAVYSIMLDDEPAGFAIFTRFPDRVLYLAGIILRPGIQGRGVSEAAVKQAREPDDRFLALRTQSAIMWAAGRHICGGNWLPAAQKSADGELVQLGGLVARRIGCPDYPVAKGFYGQALYGEKPKHRDREIQAWWDKLCSFERGDAVICIGRLP